MIFCRRKMFLASVTVLLFALTLTAFAQQGASDTGLRFDELTTASVVVDGMSVGTVRGLSSFPAEDRAKLIRNQVTSVAGDEAFSTAS